VRSSAIRPEEEALRGTLEEIDEEVRGRGGGTGRLRGKVNELWAGIGVWERTKRDGGSGVGGNAGVEWAVVDEEGLSQIAQVCIYFWEILLKEFIDYCRSLLINRPGSCM
jgi:nuclear pore complex protein Nup54